MSGRPIRRARASGSRSSTTASPPLPPSSAESVSSASLRISQYFFARVISVRVNAVRGHRRIENVQGELYENHWVVCFLLPGDGLVCVDILDPSTGRTTLTSKAMDGQSLASTVAEFHMPAQIQFTPASVVELIRTRGYDRYRLTYSHGGVRWWVFCIIRLLTTEGLVHADAPDRLFSWIENLYGHDGLQTYWPIRRGLFDFESSPDRMLPGPPGLESSSSPSSSQESGSLRDQTGEE